jgi:hypothetical protein
LTKKTFLAKVSRQENIKKYDQKEDLNDFFGGVLK